MANRAQDATWRLARMALAHDLGKLFSSQPVNPHEAIADAVGCECEMVKQSRFVYHLGLGLAAGIPRAGLKWPAIVDRLQASESIRPAMGVWNSTLWPFLRGELAPDLGISELVDHHLASVNFERIATEEDLRCRLRARPDREKFECSFFYLVVSCARSQDIPNFLRSAVAVTDKLTIVGLLYVHAYLKGDLSRAESLEWLISEFLNSTMFEDALGAASKGVRREMWNRLFKGQLPFSYGQRPTEFVRLELPCDIVIPNAEAERFLGNVIDRCGWAHDEPAKS